MTNVDLPSYPIQKRFKWTVLKLLYNRKIKYLNIEGNKAFNFELRSGRKPPGSSVMLRAKNEEDCIERCIRSIYDTFEEIVFVDNGSNDSTLSIVTALKTEIDSGDKLRIYEYPFLIARCGKDHAETDENSLHSLAYYYNWCLSKLKFNYVVKWDADMYLKPDCTRDFRTYLAAIQKQEVRLEIPIQTVYIDRESNAWTSNDEINVDNTIFPNRPYIRYKKGKHWEVFHCGFYLPPVYYTSPDVYEIKDTRKDEFSHWSSAVFPTERKQKEWENFNKIKSGCFGEGFRKVAIDGSTPVD